MRKSLIMLLIIPLSFALINCSDDDKESKNPSSPETVFGTGTYVGTTSFGEPITIEIKAIDGEAWLTKINLTFSNKSNHQQSLNRLAKIENRSFSHVIGSTDEEVVTGTINDENTIINGSYNINTIISEFGTYSATKQ